jgi:Gpi18-like mannosyltransferase
MRQYIISYVLNTQTLHQRAAWSAFKVFASLRLLTLLWVLLFALTRDRTIVEPEVLCKTRSLSENSSNPSELLNSAVRWDTVCYLLIAESGYTVQAGLTGWPPLYPILIRVFALIFHPPILAALVVSGLATWLAFTLLYILITENHNETKARNSLFLYAIYPHSFFLIYGYSEATFFVLVIASLLSAQKKYWGWAGILAGAAALTRNQGVLLSIVLLGEGILQLREKPERRFTDFVKPFLASIIPILAFGAFSLYVHEILKAGWPWQTLRYYWGEYLGFPWQGILGNAKRLITVTTSTDLYWLPTTVVDLIFAVTIPLVLVFNLRLGRSSHMIYAWMVLLLSLIKLEPNDTLWAFSRYAITIFPFFIAASPIVNNRYARLGLVAFGLMLQGILVYMFYIWSLAG